ncbi:3-beta hydroxysteroid dehydrogenase/isomerase family-domain-containing protein [Pisolithus tinctorius]|uniref:3-beta hydroxysteroid dehydrogenase/isomerase domain-containing protein n=1 Tax=Pisolithus tinctorius Marx 270 TaxID=870435 RepID=A0A0C3NX42_PISTI|nr:3-beta hydroxysteroid dehydrogenase/isomerase family-domain-containing protein [Pisolithus tinctorius]KIN99900.1 hypothetical protein M404DRAFT_153819 [Pisolithus tinctorius Marx 270]
MTKSLQEEDAYQINDRSGFIGQCIIGQLTRGDAISVLDIVQRHHDVLFYSGDTTDDWDMLDILERLGITYIIQNALLQRGVRDPSVYYKANVEDTWVVVGAAIMAGICGLVYTSSASIVFDGTDVMNVNEQVPYLEKPFDTYNGSKAQGEKIMLEANGKDGLLTIALRPAGVFRPRGCQIGGSRSLFDCTYDGNITRMILLAGDELVPPPSYSSTMSSEPRLDPEGTTAKLNESLHCVLPAICATTEYHRLTQTLGPYVTPPPNAESILSAHNTPFDPCEPTGFVVHSRADEQASFVTSGEPIYILEATELFDECERWLSSPKIQDTYMQLRKVIGV